MGKKWLASLWELPRYIRLHGIRSGYLRIRDSGLQAFEQLLDGFWLTLNLLIRGPCWLGVVG